MVKILHAADLHLGTPLKAVSEQSDRVRKALQDATYEALKRIVDTAIEEAVEVVLFAGDIYDRESRSVRANQFFQKQMERLNRERIPVVLIYGNHDPVESGLEFFTPPDNVSICSAEQPSTVEIDQDASPLLRVVGQSYRSKHEKRKMVHRFTPGDETVPNIGLLHTNLDPDGTRYVPCDRKDLRQKENIHYWALGHRHHMQCWKDDTSTVAYPGTPQGTNPTETGLHGCIIADVSSDAQSELQFVSTSPVVWLRQEVSLEELDPPPENVEELIQAMKHQGEQLLQISRERLREAVFSGEIPCEIPDDLISGFIVRWYVTGEGAVHEQLEDEEEVTALIEEQLNAALSGQTPFVWTESVHLETSPPIPSLSELREKDEVYEELSTLYQELQNASQTVQEFQDVIGKVWKRDEDHEDQDPRHLYVDEDRMEQWMKLALRRMIKQIESYRSDVG